MQSLFDMFQNTFEQHTTQIFLNTFIRYPVKHNNIEPLLPRLEIILLYPDIIQLDFWFFPKIFAWIQEVGQLNHQLNQLFEVQLGFYLTFRGILHVGIQCFDAVSLHFVLLDGDVFDTGQVFAVTLNEIGVGGESFGVWLFYLH